MKNAGRRSYRIGVKAALLATVVAFVSSSAIADPSSRFRLAPPSDSPSGNPCSSDKHPARFQQFDSARPNNSNYLHRVSHCTPTLPAPSLGATKVGDTTVSLIWNLPAGVTNFDHYEVWRSLNATSAVIATPTATTMLDTTVSAGQIFQYQYRVRVVDTAGNVGPFSPVASVVTPPTAPGNLNVSNVTDLNVTLTWTAGSAQAGVTGYRIERCQGSGCSTFAEITGVGAVLTYVDSAVLPSTPYSYRVRTLDAFTNLSPYSSTASTTTLADATPPTAPTNLVASVVANGEVQLAWAAATDASGIVNYQVERCTGTSCSSFSQVGTPATVTFTQTGLTSVASYRYRVRAVDGASLAGGYSNVIVTVPMPVITTVAGNTALGDGGPATSGWLRVPQGVARASDGTLYIADAYGHRIRKVAPDGTLTTVAGTGVNGFDGEGGPAPAADLQYPSGVAVATDGTLYIADRYNHRIRKVAPNGTITTIAGTGTLGFSGDGAAALAAQLNYPTGLTLATDGSLYFTDQGNQRVRKIVSNGTITTVAGTGTAGATGDGGAATAAQLNQPFGLALAADGSLYIADQYNHRIRKVASNGIITTVAGTGAGGFAGDGGQATAAALGYPTGIAVAADGSLFIADTGNHRIRKVASDGVITTFAGVGTVGFSGDGGQAAAAQFNFPFAPTVVPDGSLYVVDAWSHRIRKIAPNGVISTVAGTGGFFGSGVLATAGQLVYPQGMTVAPDGSLYIADTDFSKVYRVAPDGTITTIAGTGAYGYNGDGWPATQAWLRRPSGLARAVDGTLYIADRDNHRIRKVGLDGLISTVAGTGVDGFSGDGGPATAAQLDTPFGLALASDGTLYIADKDNHRIRKVAPNGTITTIAGTGTAGFGGDGGPATAAQLYYPFGLALAADGSLYVADTNNSRIRKIAPNGTITTVAGKPTWGFSGDGGSAINAELNFPWAVALGTDGSIYIADTWNHRVRRVSPAGSITTVAGTGEFGFGGDGGPATGAQLDTPRGVAVGPDGSLYVVDTDNHAIRRIAAPTGVVEASANNVTDSAATITWTTATAMDTQVRYGPTTVYGNSSPLNSALVTSHSVNVTGLTASTTYHYQVVSKTAIGQVVLSGDATFTTLADQTPPVISTVSAGGFAATEATITWTTNEPADSQAEYGLTTAYGSSSPLLPALATGHSVTLTGLTASTLYHYRVKSKDALNNPAVSADFTFTLPSASSLPTAPGSFIVSSASDTEVTLTWTAASGPNGVTGYRVERCQGSGCANFATIASVGAVLTYTDIAVTPGATYNYRARAVDPSGNLGAYSSVATAIVSSDQTPPTVPANLTASVVASGEVFLSWTAATDASGIANYQVERCTGTSCSNFSQVGTPTAVTFTDAGLTSVASYRYRVRAVDGVGHTGNYSNTVTTIPLPVITTVAGNTALGDGGPATSGWLRVPQAIARAADGTLYIADAYNHRIRKVAPDGTITTVAGTGTNDFGGDGGPATAAELDHPSGVAVTTEGTVYLADRYNHRIRKVAPDGTITTIAGTGTAGFSGDNGPATSAKLNYPTGLALASDGTLSFTDQGNHRVRQIASNGTITTVAGIGTAGSTGDGGAATAAQLNQPFGLARAADGSLYIADQYNGRIRKVAPDGTITTVAGNGSNIFSGDGGPATAAGLAYPLGVAMGADGSLYIADTNNLRIRKVALNGVITTIAGSSLTLGFSGDGGQATAAQFRWPFAVTAASDGSLYVIDAWNHRARKIAPDGVITTVAGTGGYSGTGTAATTVQFAYTKGFIATPDGTFYLTDADSNQVRHVASDGTITTVAGTGAYGYLGDGGQATAAWLRRPSGLARASDGTLYVADTENSRIRKIAPNGLITTLVGTGTYGFSGDGGPAIAAQLSYPFGLALAADGNLYIADRFNYRIRKVAPDGTITTIAGTGECCFGGDGGPASAAKLTPRGLALAPDGSLYIADELNSRIRRIAPDGVITTVAGTGALGFSGDDGPATAAKLSFPDGVTLSPDGGLYIADTYNSRVRRVTSSGTITTIAGTGDDGFSGDGGLATAAEINLPEAVAVGPDGRLYVVDTDNHAIRRIAAPTGVVEATANNVTDSAATITWTTATAMDTQVRYGPTMAYGSSSPLNSTLVTNHSVTLTGLSYNTTYHYQVASKDAIGQVVLSGNATFTTLPDQTPPIISGVTTSNLAATGVTITWTTNEPADSQAEYGLTTAYGSSSPLLPALATGHSVTLTGLTASTLYHYRVKSKDALSNLASSSDFTFTTPVGGGDTTPPSAPATLTSVANTPSQVTLTWAAATDNVGVSFYRIERCQGSGCTTFSNLVSVGAVLSFVDATVSSVNTYRYRVRAQDGDGNLGDYSPVTTVLVAINDSPTAPTNLAASVVASGEVILQWTAATDDHGVANYQVERCQGTTCSSFSQVGSPTVVTFAETGLTPMNSYRYRVRAVDTSGVSGNYSNIVATIPTLMIASVAGNFSLGDGGAATLARVDSPDGIALAADGNLYIADTDNHRIRKVASDGTITTVAGTGTYGDSGDGGPAAAAKLGYLEGVAIGSDGSVYIADTDNYRVKRVAPNGTITTIAGTGIAGYSGDGGQATSAKLRLVEGIAVASDGSVYVADSTNHRIRKVAPNGVITTVAGTGVSGYSGDGGQATSAQLKNPSGVAVASDGSFYIADTSNHRIRKVNPSGIITTVAGTGVSGYSGDGGQATSAKLKAPEGVGLAADGTLFIADTNNHRIRKVATTGVISTVAGTGSFGFSGDGGQATSAQLDTPEGVMPAVDGSLYISDTWNNRIRKVATNGVITTVVGGSSGDGGLATAAALYYPEGAVLAADGSLYIADTRNHRIRKVAPDGVVSTIAGIGGTYGGFSGDGGQATAAKLSYPEGVVLAADGTLYIADTSNHRIRKVATNGVITTVAGTGSLGYSGDGGQATAAKLYSPSSIVISGDGTFYIADTSNHRVRKVAPGGIITTIAGTGTGGFSGDGGLATTAQLYYPEELALAADGSLYITDNFNHRIRRIDSNGIITTIAGTGTAGFSGDGGQATAAKLFYPEGIALRADGSLFIADGFNYRVRRVAPDGTITTVAGTGSYGYSGDGGLATSAKLDTPRGMAVGTDGRVYVVDTDNHVIRRISGPATVVDTSVSNITASSATITWSTQAAADSQVNFGSTTAYGSSSPPDSTLITSHSVTLSGLSAATTYHFQVVSRDAAGNLIMSGDATFTTLP